jgi:hypothetical protein
LTQTWRNSVAESRILAIAGLAEFATPNFV